MTPFTFKALVTLDDGELPAGRFAGSVVLRGHCAGPPVSTMMFTARIVADDDEPLRPGDRRRVVTITVTDDRAAQFFSPGRHFEVLTGHEVGRGTVSRRLVTLGALADRRPTTAPARSAREHRAPEFSEMLQRGGEVVQGGREFA
jgi:hypothetical protein